MNILAIEENIVADVFAEKICKIIYNFVNFPKKMFLQKKIRQSIGLRKLAIHEKMNLFNVIKVIVNSETNVTTQKNIKELLI